MYCVSARIPQYRYYVSSAFDTYSFFVPMLFFDEETNKISVEFCNVIKGIYDTKLKALYTEIQHDLGITPL